MKEEEEEKEHTGFLPISSGLSINRWLKLQAHYLFGPQIVD
jgi:hypothetical protein